ncbi:MAG: hypothetical protein JXD19_07695 [Deltaproteobacteria bacterium]|nr:hypothetical protein [Deltaproteobacteria bacterium]
MENTPPNIQPLFYEISGPEVLKEEIPLYEVLGSLREYMNILDRSYLTLTGKDRLTKKERKSYKIIAYKFSPGSLNIDLSIQTFDILQHVFPFIIPAGAHGVWELAKSSYDFVKLVYEARSENRPVEVSTNNSVEQLVQQDGNNIQIHPSVAINAEHIENSVIIISNQIREGINRYTLQDENEQGIKITENEKRLFSPETIVDDKPESLLVNIYRLDTESRKGKLHAIERGEIRDIPFQIVGDQAIEPYIEALKSEQVKITALKELAKNIEGKDYVARLQIINFPDFDSRQKGLFK